MENETYEIQLEGMLTIRKNGELIAVNSNDMKKRAHVFSTCTSMGEEEIKKLLENLNGSQPTA